MKKLSVILAAGLAACGGGEVNCTQPNACVFNVTGNTVTNSGAVTPPPPPASAPASAPASSPAPAPAPAPAVPFGKVFGGGAGGYKATTGELSWKSGGLTYIVQVHDYGFAAGVALMSCSLSDCFGTNQSWLFETWLDDSLDIKGPRTADDATLKSYLETRVVPKLDAWIQANGYRLNGLQTAPFNTAAVPTTWAPYDRLAALLPRWVIVTPTGAFLAP